MLTRCLRIIAIAALALAQPAFAHHVDTPVADSGTATASATSVVLTGTVRRLTVEDRTTGKTTTYHTLRLDDGTAVELTGAAADLLGIGGRAQVTGLQTGSRVAISQAQTLARSPSAAAIAAPSQAQGILTLTHSDDFARGHGDFGYAVRPVDGGRAVPLVLGLMPDTLRNGMQVVATGSVTADAVSLDTTSITIVTQPAPKVSMAADLTALAQTTNNTLFVLVTFTDYPTAAFTQSAVDAVVQHQRKQRRQVLPGNLVQPGAAERFRDCPLAAIDPTTKVPVAAPTSCDWSTIGAQADAAADQGRLRHRQVPEYFLRVSEDRRQDQGTTATGTLRLGRACLRQLRSRVEQWVQPAFRLRARARS